MNDDVRNLVIGSIVLVLAAMYGGEMLGSWFSFHSESNSEGTSYDSESTFNFMLEEVEFEMEFDGDKDSESADYDDNDYDLDELDDLMLGKIKNLLFLVIIAGGAALFFLSQEGGNEGMVANACLAVGVSGLLAAAMFFMSFPEAIDDDMEMFEDIGCDADDEEDPSFFGSEDCDNDDYGIDSEWSWRPGLAWVLVLLSGIMGMAAYSEARR